MADAYQVCNALVNAVASALFASTYVPGSIQQSTLGYNCLVARDHPEPTLLNDSLNNSVTLITVNDIPGMVRQTSRFTELPVAVYSVPITVTTNVSSNQLTISGTPTVGQVIGVGVGLNGYAYRCNAVDTASSVANGLGSLIPNSSVSGSTITLNTDRFVVNVVSDTTTLTEVRRQKAYFSITVWTNDPDARDVISAAIDSYIAGIRAFTFVDYSISNIPEYSGSEEYQGGMKAGLFRRTLKYCIEYPTVQTATTPSVLFLGGIEGINYANTITYGQT